jgi:hypothetical protein
MKKPREFFGEIFFHTGFCNKNSTYSDQKWKILSLKSLELW